MGEVDPVDNSFLSPCARAARGPSAERKDLFFCFPATYSSARDTRLGNVAGYYQPPLAALGDGRRMHEYPIESHPFAKGCGTQAKRN
jgi:hypothetical protein